MESINDWIQNGNIEVRVQPGASKTELITENSSLKLYLKAQPEKGKANSALVKFFRKEFKLDVEVVRGKTSRNKVLKIL